MSDNEDIKNEDTLIEEENQNSSEEIGRAHV